MTYLQFHLIFTVPPTVLLAWGLIRIGPDPLTALLGRRWSWALLAIAAIAFVYTTPWDNYLVWKEVWWYGPDRVLGTIGYVPVEEYLFFLIQPLMTGLWTYHVLARRRGASRHGLREIPGLRLEPAPSHPARVRLAGAIPWLILAALGMWLLTVESALYLGLILAWAAPVIALIWLYMGPELSRMLRVLGLAVAVPTLYLWVADGVAIHQGIWDISQQYTLGPRPWGLPLEEAIFFLVTNILVALGTLLFLIPGMEDEGGTEIQGPGSQAGLRDPS